MGKIPVLQATLLKRINRHLQKDGRHVYRSQSAPLKRLAGDWHMRHETRGIVRKHVDLQALGCELGVLAKWECVK